MECYRTVTRLLRTVALLLAIALLLAGCGGAAPGSAPGAAAGAGEDLPPAARPVDDSLYELDPGEEELPLDGGSMPIALVTDASGVDVAGRNAVVWRSLQSFAIAFNYTVQLYTAADASQEALNAALTEAAQGGAIVVVCVGEALAVAVHELQGEYPTVGFLLLDAEPHSADYGDYTSESNVYSILFHEEQAAYLAGYAAVMEGYTDLGFLGGRAVPEAVRSCTGFLQGAEAAAYRQGLQVNVRTWYSGQENASEALTDMLSGWYSDGIEVVFAAGGTLAESCIAAAKAAGSGLVIAADWDQNALDPTVLTTAQKCYNTVLQNTLYDYFQAGGYWAETDGGRTARMGAADGGVALPAELWRFASFSLDEYARLYDDLRTGAAAVEIYADADELPPLNNVTVEGLR